MGPGNAINSSGSGGSSVIKKGSGSFNSLSSCFLDWLFESLSFPSTLIAGFATSVELLFDAVP